MVILQRIFFLSFLLLYGCATPTVLEGQKFDYFPHTLQKAAPTVILSHGSDCNIAHANMVARKLNEWGYNAIILNHCTRRNIPPHVGSAGFLAPWDRSQDYFQVAKWIRTQSWHLKDIAVIGWSQGGAGVLNAINYRTQKNLGRSDEDINSIDAYISFYPGCDLATPPDQPHRPTLILHGQKDELAHISKCPYPTLKDKRYSIIIYPDAGHGFDVGGPTATMCKEIIGCVKTRDYNSEAHKLSDTAIRLFLSEHLRK